MTNQIFYKTTIPCFERDGRLIERIEEESIPFICRFFEQEYSWMCGANIAERFPAVMLSDEIIENCSGGRQGYNYSFGVSISRIIDQLKELRKTLIAASEDTSEIDELLDLISEIEVLEYQHYEPSEEDCAEDVYELSFDRSYNEEITPSDEEHRKNLNERAEKKAHIWKRLRSFRNGKYSDIVKKLIDILLSGYDPVDGVTLGKYLPDLNLIVLYYKAIIKNSKGYNAVNAIEMTLAHEAFHAFHAFFSSDSGSAYRNFDRFGKNTRKAHVVRESHADYFSVQYALSQGFLRSANKRIDMWKEYALTSWPYAYALFFLVKLTLDYYDEHTFEQCSDHERVKKVIKESASNYLKAFDTLVFDNYLLSLFQSRHSNINAFVITNDRIERYKADHYNAMGFREKLLEFIDHSRFKGQKDSSVYRAAGLQRNIWHDIMNERNKTVTKETVAAFAVALHLTVDEAQELMVSAGKSFDDHSDWDLLIKLCLEEKNYVFDDINDAICRNKLGKFLGSGYYSKGD